MIEALLETDMFLKVVASVLITEANGVVDVSPNREGKIKRFVRTAKKTVAARLSSRSECLTTYISHDRTNGEAYSVTNSDEEERQGEMEDRDRRTREKRIWKMLKSVYQSGQVTLLKVVKPVSALFRRPASYCKYHLIEKFARYEDDVVHEVHRMVEKTVAPNEGHNVLGKVSYRLCLLTETFVSLQRLWER